MRGRAPVGVVWGPLSAVRKLKYVVPNAFTALSMLLGVTSITRSAAGDYELAAWMILWGVLLDKLDGSAARLLGASSGFGVQFDSFADFIVFGLAPAALFYYQVTALGGGEGLAGLFLVVACGLYILATAGRLARFNITEPPMGDRIFYGIPTTLWGAILGCSYLTWHKYHLAPELVLAAPVVLVFAGLLMVSQVKLPKLKKRKGLAFNIFQLGNVIAAYVLGPLMLMPEILLGQALTYTVVGVGYCLLHPPVPEPPALDDAVEGASVDEGEAEKATV